MAEVKATKIWLVLDSSGSIATQVVELCSGVNNFIDEQRSLMAECYLNMVTFDLLVRPLYEGLIEGAPILNPSKYTLGGYTALYDAVGLAIAKTLTQPEFQHMIVIFTDGGENASKKYTLAHLQNLVASAEAKGISIVYLGAGLGAIREAQNMRLPVTSTLSVGNSGEAYTRALLQSSTQLMAMRTGHSTAVAFSGEDRKYQTSQGAS